MWLVRQDKAYVFSANLFLESKVGPILGSSIQDFKTSARGTLASPSSFRGAIQLNGVISSRDACIILASLHKVVKSYLNARRWFASLFFIWLEGLPYLPCIAYLPRGGSLPVSYVREANCDVDVPRSRSLLYSIRRTERFLYTEEIDLSHVPQGGSLRDPLSHEFSLCSHDAILQGALCPTHFSLMT